MPLATLPVGPGELPAFLAYSEAFGRLHDESFLPGADFVADGDRPSYLLVDTEGGGKPLGAVSLLLTRRFLAGGRGRFALLHSVDGGRAGYRLLLTRALEAAKRRVTELYLFLPAGLGSPRDHLEEVGFVLERNAYLLGADSIDAPPPELPPGYSFASVRRGDTAALEAFTAVRNRNFAEVLGSLPSAIADWEEVLAGSEVLDGGLILLVSPGGEACGTLLLERDEEPGAVFLGAISVDAARRGRGLGRALVREALSRARAAGFVKAYLSVNALNDRALRLYTSEGFVERRTMSCLAVSLDRLEAALAPDSGSAT
ncbi:MAG: GNAT family N-acetyltransferase [Spirochaetaceae bacterium]|nr:GNAT family N-acetyltransferase [Spirochaetaceae bacterium]